MYKLQFKKTSSRYFSEALSFAKELGGVLKDGFVIVELVDVINAYVKIRQLFAIVQHWKGTSATFKGKPVHPYQFLLNAHWIGDCYDDRLIDANCGDTWSCMRIDNLRYNIESIPYKSHRYWYEYGKYNGYKWQIDKKAIYNVLFKYAEEKAITECPFFDEEKLRLSVMNLPDHLFPDNETFEIVYKEQYIKGEKILIPFNIRHLYKPKKLQLL